MVWTGTARARHVADLAHADQPARAALEFAKFAYPEVDTANFLDILDHMASRVEGHTHLALRRIVSIREGMGGNVEDLRGAENYFLNRVIETRKGNSVSLSLIWIEVGSRTGIEVLGVALPGHFVVYANGQMCDPFHYGEAIGFDEAAALVAGAIGGPPRLDRSWLEPVDTPYIIRSMLKSLETLYTDQGAVADLEWVENCLEVL